MATFKDAVSTAAKSEVCRIVNDPVLGLSFGLNLGPVSVGALSIPQSTSKLLCDGNPTFTPPSPPFTGGQCPGVNYAVFITVIDNAGQVLIGPGAPAQNPTQSNLNRWPGPIGGIRIKRRNNNNQRWTWAITANGIEIDGTLSIQAEPQSATITSVSRIDGNPDNCGNPPSPPIPPYSPTTNNYNITYEDNNGTTINEGIDLTILAPIIGSGNVIYAPIKVETPDINLNGTLELFPDFKLNLQPSFTYAPGGNSDDEYPDPDLPYPQPPEADGEKVIVGAVVTATDAEGGRATIISQGDNPDIFAPRLGNIAFYIRTDKGAAWTNDIPIKSVRTYIPCPVNFGAVAVAGTADSGYVLDIEPVWQYRLAPR